MTDRLQEPRILEHVNGTYSLRKTGWLVQVFGIREDRAASRSGR